MNSMAAVKDELQYMNLGDQQRLAERLIEVAYLLGQRDGLREAREIFRPRDEMSWQEATS